MKHKLVIQFSNGSFANVTVDRIEREENFVLAYNGGALVGIVDLASIDYLYVSETRAKEGQELDI